MVRKRQLGIFIPFLVIITTIIVVLRLLRTSYQINDDDEGGKDSRQKINPKKDVSLVIVCLRIILTFCVKDRLDRGLTRKRSWLQRDIRPVRGNDVVCGGTFRNLPRDIHGHSFPARVLS